MNLTARGEARAAGAMRYFTGRPCKNGHVAERWAHNGVCWDCIKEYQKAHLRPRALNPTRAQQRATCAVYRAILRGEIERPETCEACGLRPGSGPDGRALIQGHHHRGYEPEARLDVRWLCAACHKASEPGSHKGK